MNRSAVLAVVLIVGLTPIMAFASDPGPPNEPTAARLLAAMTRQPDRIVVLADKPNPITFPAVEARFVRLVVQESDSGQVCLDELEIYGPAGEKNLALARDGAKATASSCLSGYAIHQISHLNDGLYGNDHSWIAGSTGPEWAQIELPKPCAIDRVVISRDRAGPYRDRLPTHLEVQVSQDGQKWQTVREASATAALPLPTPLTWDALLAYAFLTERSTWERVPEDDPLAPDHAGRPYWRELVHLGATERVLRQMSDLIDRLEAQHLDVRAEKAQLEELTRRQTSLAAAKTSSNASDAELSLYFDARLAKRALFFRDPSLTSLQKILFVKRQPYTPSHNYSDILDSAFRPGGGVFVLEVPTQDGRLQPAEAKLRCLFDATNGIARDPAATFDASKVVFAYRPSSPNGTSAYWHVMQVNSDGSDVKQLTSGPFHDYYPTPLPDGGLAFVSTRCRSRFLCWRPQAFVLFRMNADGSNITPLSHSNLSEWAPSVMSDGRIIWTRSEYLDKGADFGHTLWAIRPDGSHPTLLFGNDTRNCYVNGREVPGTSELCCTLFSHGGDLNGTIAYIDTSHGPFAKGAITMITPDAPPHYHMDWAQRECFRDPVPISRDHVLVSHAPADRFGLYVIDRYGNREVLSLDPAMGSMCPTPFRPEAAPPLLDRAEVASADSEEGEFFIADVYQGLGPAVPRGSVKYVRVCQEVRAELERLPNGEFRADHEPFQDYYASPTHIIQGPYGWPSFVAKASLGLAPVETDGSASFRAPAGKVLYFEVLDENLNEIQRMRSVVQLQPGEKRSCIGCHEDRTTAPPVRQTLASKRLPNQLEEPSWGAVPFAYEQVVQPVWNARCVSCHDAKDARKIDLTGTLDGDRVPASYRTLITQGWAHYFDYTWGREHEMAQPLTFGTVKSRLWTVLDAGHHGVTLSRDEMHRVKCWTDLNCPLWPDYRYRLDRPTAVPTVAGR